MAISRSEAIAKIEAQRAAIREHIDKYFLYPNKYDKDFAWKTIQRCQAIIESIKNKCDSYIPASYEDSWNPWPIKDTKSLYALKDYLLELKNQLLLETNCKTKKM